MWDIKGPVSPCWEYGNTYFQISSGQNEEGVLIIPWLEEDPLISIRLNHGNWLWKASKFKCMPYTLLLTKTVQCTITLNVLMLLIAYWTYLSTSEPHWIQNGGDNTQLLYAQIQPHRFTISALLATNYKYAAWICTARIYGIYGIF